MDPTYICGKNNGPRQYNTRSVITVPTALKRLLSVYFRGFACAIRLLLTLTGYRHPHGGCDFLCFVINCNVFIVIGINGMILCDMLEVLLKFCIKKLIGFVLYYWIDYISLTKCISFLSLNICLRWKISQIK